MWGNPALILLALCSYLVGALPFSLFISRLKGVDLRNVGSGNLGATNVYRALGLGFALLVFFLDALKGYIPTLIALNVTDQSWIHVLVGGLAIMGHSLSPFVNFRGGKGAATGLGFLMAISPDVCAIIIVIAVLGIAIGRYVAPVTLLCSILTPFLLWKFAYPMSYVLFVSLICVFIIWRHRPNIIRLIQGKENRI